MKFLLFAISCTSLYIHSLKKVLWNLNRNELCWLYLLFVVFAKKDFEVLNHRSWRCKEKLKHQRNEGNHDNDSVSNDFNTVNLVNLDCNKIVNNDCHKCICGKKCKGLMVSGYIRDYAEQLHL